MEATHDFLTPDDVDRIEREVADIYLPQLDLTVAEADGRIAGFSGLSEGTLEALFVDAGWRGHGVGCLLLRAALDREPGLRVDVNEQNGQAVGFYLSHGFEQIGRSETDSEGRPFPILHLAPRES